VENWMYKSCPFKVVYDSLKLEPPGKVRIELLGGENYRIKLNDGLHYDTVMSTGKRFKRHGFDFIIVPREPGSKTFESSGYNSYYFYFADPAAVARQYSSKLSVAPIAEDASIVTLSVTGLVPEQEVDYLNGLMTEYINYGLENKNGTADSTISFINRQILIISDSLKNTEGRMENFRKANNFFNISQEGTIIQNKLEKVENEKTAF